MMPNEPDLAQQHSRFSATCFNQTWEFLNKPNRSAAEDLEMLACSWASLWHWLQRGKECKPKNLSVGYWQLSRVYAILGQGDNAFQFAEICLSHSHSLSAFYMGYAYEALARAAATQHNEKAMADFLVTASHYAEKVEQPEERQWLTDDLASIRLPKSGS